MNVESHFLAFRECPNLVTGGAHEIRVRSLVEHEENAGDRGRPGADELNRLQDDASQDGLHHGLGDRSALNEKDSAIAEKAADIEGIAAASDERGSLADGTNEALCGAVLASLYGPFGYPLKLV